MTSSEREGVEMEIEVRTLEAQKTMVVRSVVSYSELGEAFGRNLPRIFEYAKDSVTGPPFGRYPSMPEDDKVDVEMGLPVRAHLEVSNDITPGEIPGGRYAVAVVVGPYDGLPKTYKAVFDWISANGHTTGGAPFESYVDDPTTTPADTVRTEVCIPIA